MLDPLLFEVLRERLQLEQFPIRRPPAERERLRVLRLRHARLLLLLRQHAVAVRSAVER